MKMKKITLGCSFLLAATLLIVSCNKKDNVAPEPDLDFQSAKDASFANSAIIELETIVSYAGDNQFNSNYFAVPSGQALPTATITNQVDTSGANKKITITYVDSVRCVDGKKRNGSIIIDYTTSNFSIGGKFYRRPGYVAKVTLNNYWVDGILIGQAAPFEIRNTTAFNFNSATTNETWTMDGYFSIKEQNYMQDSSKNMIWKGKLTKTLLNTSDPSILTANLNNPINWVVYVNNKPVNGAKVAYTGTITGVTKRVVSYTYVVDETKTDKALYRDFTCSPDPLLNVITTPTVSSVYSEWHPVISGVASFTSLGQGTTEERTIVYGDESGAKPCDNSGVITIKGISYAIDFRKK